MIASLGLLLLILLMSRAVAPAMRGARWVATSPGWGIFAWLGLMLALVLAWILAGLVAAVAHLPATHSISGFLHACTETFGGHYDSVVGAAVGATGLFLASLTVTRIALAARNQYRSSSAVRRRLRTATHLAARPDARGFVVVADSDPVVCCLPHRSLRRGGTVVVSSRALELLSTEQLDAVLKHERMHLRARHFLAVSAVFVVADAFWNRCGTALAREAVAELVEMHADDAVGLHERALLAEAMLLLATPAQAPVGAAAPGSGQLTTPPAALGMGGSSVIARARRLLLTPRPLTRRQRLVVNGSTALTAAMPLLVVGIPSIVALAVQFCHLTGAVPAV